MVPFVNGNNRNPTSLAVVGTATVTVVTTIYYLWKMQSGRKRSRQKGHPGAKVETTYNTNIIYLDYNGTTPVYPEVLQAMMPFFQIHFGNPGSQHVLGDAPRQAIQLARRQILVDLLGANGFDTTDTTTPDSSSVVVSKENLIDTMDSSILFTACGTESDNFIIHLALQRQTPKKSTHPTIPHIVTSNVEHPAIDACLRHYERIGRCTVTFVPVQTDGRVCFKDVIAAIRPNTYVK
jgi:cysteine desulfurase